MLLSMMHQVRQHLASLPAFRQLVRVSSPAEAQERVLTFAEETATDGWPAWATFYPTTDLSLDRLGHCGYLTRSQSVILLLVIRVDDHSASSIVDAFDWASKVLADFMMTPPVNHLDFAAVEQIRPPNLTPEDNPIVALLNDRPVCQFAFQIRRSRQ